MVICQTHCKWGSDSLWKWPNFRLSRARDHDLGSGHTAYRPSSVIDFYLHTKFHWNRRNCLCTATYCQFQSHVTRYVLLGLRTALVQQGKNYIHSKCTKEWRVTIKRQPASLGTHKNSCLNSRCLDSRHNQILKVTHIPIPIQMWVDEFLSITST